MKGKNQDGALIAVVILLGVTGLMVWFGAKEYLAFCAIKMTWASIIVIDIVVSFAQSHSIPDNIIAYVIPTDILEQIPSLKYWLPRTDPKQVSFKQFKEMLEIGGVCLRPFIPFIGIAGIIFILKKTKTAKFTRKMDIFQLAKLMQNEFPQIRPAIMENLENQHPDEGYFRREDSPIRFAIKHGLITAYKINFKGELINEIVTPTFDKKKSKKSLLTRIFSIFHRKAKSPTSDSSNAQDNKIEYEVIKDHYKKGISKLHNRCIFDREKAAIVYSEQLGPAWTSSDDLPPFIKGLYAALIAFACTDNENTDYATDKEKSMDLLKQFNKSWQPPGKKNAAYMNVKGVNKIIKEYESTESIQDVLNSHAFVSTVFSSLLEKAREKGKLGTALFQWLKVVDRHLWYALNQEGGACAWSEAAGCRGHKLSESSAKGAIYKRTIENSVNALEEYLNNVEGWIPLECDLPKNVGDK